MIEFDIDIEIKRKNLRVFIEADGRVFEDVYGADADGNRGETRVYCDDLELSIRDFRGNDLTEDIKKYYHVLYEAIRTVAVDELIKQYHERE